MKRTLASTLLLPVLIAGCVSFEKTSSSGYGPVRVGEVYELTDGATIIYCSQFTFWGLPGSGDADCLVPRGTNRPQGGEIAKGELPGPIRLRVAKIRSVGAIDAEYEYVYVDLLPKGKRFVARSSSIFAPKYANRLDGGQQ